MLITEPVNMGSISGVLKAKVCSSLNFMYFYFRVVLSSAKLRKDALAVAYWPALLF